MCITSVPHYKGDTCWHCIGHYRVHQRRMMLAYSRVDSADRDPLTLAENMGTSVAQIQRHYSHVSTIQNAPKLTADKRLRGIMRTRSLLPK